MCDNMKDNRKLGNGKYNNIGSRERVGLPQSDDIIVRSGAVAVAGCAGNVGNIPDMVITGYGCIGRGAEMSGTPDMVITGYGCVR